MLKVPVPKTSFAVFTVPWFRVVLMLVRTILMTVIVRGGPPMILLRVVIIGCGRLMLTVL